MTTTFINKIANPPIHSTITPAIIDSTIPALKNQNSQMTIDPDWQKWFQQVNDRVNVNNYYGNPSVLLNSDFYWNRGVTSPVTQADGDGAYFSEKWQVFGASSADYTITKETFDGNSPDQIGSTNYINVYIANYTSGSLYLYQRQSGAQFLRRYQQRVMNFSLQAFNNQNVSIRLLLEIYFYFDTGHASYSQAVFFLEPGENEISSIINTEFIGSNSVGASPYVDFRLNIVGLNNNTADFDLIYLKTEIADQPTILYVDHALEKTRIDNS